MKNLRSGFMNGFTLAEVLITLGIIGVVAAMTMPTLINQTNGAEYKAAYKKTLSAISQAVTLNYALEDENFADVNIPDSSNKLGRSPNGGPSISSMLNNRMYVLKVSTSPGYVLPIDLREHPITVCRIPAGETERPQTCDDTQTEEIDAGFDFPDYFIFFKDGSMFGFNHEETFCTLDEPCGGFIDVNGAKGPNKLTVDSSKPKDIYMVKFYDQTILPGDDAAKEVLYGK